MRRQNKSNRAGENQVLRLALDLGPLMLFFAVNAFYGIFIATACFMVAIIAALIASRILTGKFAKMPMVTAVLVMVFGGLTLYLQDETFISTGWRLLTYRWAGFFIFLALLNEAVWRSVSTDTWVSFKVFGLVPLVFIFAAMQAGFLQRHAKSAK